MALKEVKVFEDENGKLWRSKEEYQEEDRKEKIRLKEVARLATVEKITKLVYPRWSTRIYQGIQAGSLGLNTSTEGDTLYSYLMYLNSDELDKVYEIFSNSSAYKTIPFKGL